MLGGQGLPLATLHDRRGRFVEGMLENPSYDVTSSTVGGRGAEEKKGASPTPPSRVLCQAAPFHNKSDNFAG